MRRVVIPNLIHILQIMRTHGRRKVNDTAWKAPQARILSENDPSLKDTRWCWECASE